MNDLEEYSMLLVSPQLVLVEAFIITDASIKPQILCLNLSLQNSLKKTLMYHNSCIEFVSFRLLGESIQRLCSYVTREDCDAHNWLFVVPLAHFLTQASKPFDKAVLLMEEPNAKDEVWWGADGFNTKYVRKKNFPKNRC